MMKVRALGRKAIRPLLMAGPNPAARATDTNTIATMPHSSRRCCPLRMLPPTFFEFAIDSISTSIIRMSMGR